MEDQYALKPAFWQTSLFCLQNIKIVKTTYDYLLIIDINKSLHFDRQIKLFFPIVSTATIQSMHHCYISGNGFTLTLLKYREM